MQNSSINNNSAAGDNATLVPQMPLWLSVLPITLLLGVLIRLIVTIGPECLRVLDGPINLGFWSTEGISGMRMVVFSAILLLIIVFFRNGLFGTHELTWSAIGARLRRMSGHREVKS